MIKDLDKRLIDAVPESTRRNTYFVGATVDAIKQQHARETFKASVRKTHTTKKGIFMTYLQKLRLTSKVGLASMAIVFTGGTAAAITILAQPTATPTVRQELPSGNHIVGYDTTNCDYFGEAENNPITPTKDSVYYEIRNGSGLTDQQVQSALQGVCEMNVGNDASNAVYKYLPKDLVGDESTPNLTINAVSQNSITLTPDSHYSSSDITVAPGLTYTHFAPDTKILANGVKISLDELKPGDSVQMIVQTSNNTKPNMPDNASTPNLVNRFNPLNDPNHITILAVVKVQPLTADPLIFYTYVGTDIVRLDRCKTSQTGFCRAYQFLPPPSK